MLWRLAATAGHLRGKAWSIAPVILAALLLFPSTSLYFVADDFQWLAKAQEVAPLPFVIGVDERTPFFRPLSLSILLAGENLFGRQPFGYHLFSLAWHSINTFLVFLLALQLTRVRWIAGIAALIFGLHPAHTLAVAWISNLNELVMSAFYLSSLLLFMLHLKEPRGGLGLLLASWVTYALALLSKESGISLTAALVGSWWLAGRGNKAGWIKLWLPFALITLIYLALQVYRLPSSYLVSQSYYKPGPHILTNLVTFFQLLVLPLQDRARSWPLVIQARVLPEWAMVTQLFSASIFVLGSIYLTVRGNLATRFSLFWLYVSFLPFLPFAWGIDSRYTYLPSAAFAIAVASATNIPLALLHRLFSPNCVRAMGAGVGLLLLIFSGVDTFDTISRFKADGDLAKRVEQCLAKSLYSQQPPPPLYFVDTPMELYALSSLVRLHQENTAVFKVDSHILPDWREQIPRDAYVFGATGEGQVYVVEGFGLSPFLCSP